jgi:exonuclease SbcD
MKLFHTADWHLGKLVHGVYMTEDQRYVLDQLIEAIRVEKPDAVIIAGDLYDRGVPPTDAVELLDRTLKTIVADLGVPVLAIAGNHDSPDRIGFGSALMQAQGLHLAGQLKQGAEPVVLRDGFGEVHVHLVPYADPAIVRHTLADESIRTHDEAMGAIVSRLELAEGVRHILVGHAFVTPSGEAADNTSDSERPLAIGGAEHVSARRFQPFHYTALGHLHQAHYVRSENIRYAGSPLKYSISEERHVKGYLVVELDGGGAVAVEKRELKPLRDMRRVEASIEELEKHPVNEDYVYVTLLNDNPVLFPMEKVRAVYPNAMHVDRKVSIAAAEGVADGARGAERSKQGSDPVRLFADFYMEVKGQPLSDAKREMFAAEFEALRRDEEGAS